MGKYTKVVATLPRHLGTEPAYQEKVEAVKKEMLKESNTTFLPASTLGKQFADTRKEVDEIKEELSEANLRLEATRQLMVEQFEVEGVSSLKLANGQLITTYPEPYAQVVDKEANRVWAIKSGLEGSMSLPWGTLNAVCKELLLKGEAEPDGVKVFAKTQVRLGAE